MDIQNIIEVSDSLSPSRAYAELSSSDDRQGL